MLDVSFRLEDENSSMKRSFDGEFFIISTSMGVRQCCWHLFLFTLLEKFVSVSVSHYETAQCCYQLELLQRHKAFTCVSVIMGESLKPAQSSSLQFPKFALSGKEGIYFPRKL